MVKPGVSDALICQIDFLASFAKLTAQPVASTAADSQDMLAALIGESATGRELLVEQGSLLALRQGHWKFIPPGGKGPKVSATTNVELGRDAGAQLYDLSNDLGETNNVASMHPERVAAMRKTLEKLQESAEAEPSTRK
jgi:arylsulfatase A-like enzyme